MNNQMTWYGGIQRMKENRKPLQNIEFDDNYNDFETRCFRKLDYDDYNNHYNDAVQMDDDRAIKKSIFTQNNDIGMVGTLETEYQQCGDIYEFIQQTKTLREKINQKLHKNKKSNKAKQFKIQDATFRPHIKAILGNNRQTKVTARTNDLQEISVSKPKTRQLKTNRLKTQNILWWEDNHEHKSKSKLRDMDFYQRQCLNLKRKKEKAEKWAQAKKIKEFEGCTFKPKLTTYRPKK